MSTIYADNIRPNLQTGVHIPGHVIKAETYDVPNVTRSGVGTATIQTYTINHKEGSNILVMCSIHVYVEHDGAWSGGTVELLRDGVKVAYTGFIGTNWSNTNYHADRANILFLDQNTTGTSTTYKLQINNIDAAQVTVDSPHVDLADGKEHNIVFMEIAQ